MIFPGLVSLEGPVTALRGVGDERARCLARLGITSIGDLLLYRPRRYEDRRHIISIANIQKGEAVTVRAQVATMGIKRYAQGRKSVFVLILEDASGNRLHCQWWNLPFMAKRFEGVHEVLVHGKAKSLKPITMEHPETEILEPGEESVHLNRIVPIYPLTEGLTQRWLRSQIWDLLSETAPHFRELRSMTDLGDLPTLATAIRDLHFPSEDSKIELSRQRLALEEYILFQTALRHRRRNLLQHNQGYRCGGDNHLIKPFLASLPYQLNGSQTKVLRELRADLASGVPARRLLQGDVGSGKTVVSACCALMTIESGYNVLLMAPTEILAQQHQATFRNWFTPLSIRVDLHTGSQKTAPPNQTGEKPGLVIGTHALIESSFSSDRIGLVIIDEQHKFGVTQREKLVAKGFYPHLLLMTATPIPRSLALTLYGDMDVSVIDKMPEGRKPIKTFLRSAADLPKVYEFLSRELRAGRQAYVVYPRIDESGTAGLKAVVSEYARLQAALAPHRVAMIHGKLKATLRDEIMAGFRAGTTHVLLSTQLIEVGMDVPNATVMLIEGAEQFGLAQLHQLRGRIGRGVHTSYCILIAQARTPEAQARLRAVASTTDGFAIAEADLKLRGPGELLGQHQSGASSFKFGDLARDFKLLQFAREIAGRDKAA